MHNACQDECIAFDEWIETNKKTFSKENDHNLLKEFCKLHHDCKEVNKIFEAIESIEAINSFIFQDS